MRHLSCRSVPLALVLALASLGCPKASGDADPGGTPPGEDAIEAEVDPDAVEEDALPGEDASPEPGIAEVPEGDACVPACEGRTCGDDGCGGACGTCDGAAICVEGACCTPACDGRACGDDGCGGLCGQCLFGLECRDGQCRYPCMKQGFDGTFRTASWKPIYATDDPRGEFLFEEATSQGFPNTVLQVEIRQYKPFVGPTGPGSYVLDGKDYLGCSVCLVINENCSVDGCEHSYLAVDGTVDFSQLAGAGGPFEATLHDVTFREVYFDLDWNSYYSSSGKTRCISEKTVSSTDVSLRVPEAGCVTAGTGTQLDANIESFTLTNCLGEKVRLHSQCGQSKLLWIILSAAWCPACAEWVPQASQVVAAHPSTDALWVVVGQDESGGSVDQAECLAYAQKSGLDPARTFYDDEWTTVISNIHPYTFFGLPFNILLDADNMSYYWSNGVKGDLGLALSYLRKN